MSASILYPGCRRAPLSRALPLRQGRRAALLPAGHKRARAARSGHAARGSGRHLRLNSFVFAKGKLRPAGSRDSAQAGVAAGGGPRGLPGEGPGPNRCPGVSGGSSCRPSEASVHSGPCPVFLLADPHLHRGLAELQTQDPLPASTPHPIQVFVWLKVYLSKVYLLGNI